MTQTSDEMTQRMAGGNGNVVPFDIFWCSIFIDTMYTKIFIYLLNILFIHHTLYRNVFILSSFLNFEFISIKITYTYYT